MANRKPLTDDEGEVRELKAEDFKHAIPFSKLPESLQEKLRSLKRRGPQRAPTKEMVSIRLSRDVLDRLRASGRGWQSRVDAHLRKWVQNESAPKAKVSGRK